MLIYIRNPKSGTYGKMSFSVKALKLSNCNHGPREARAFRIFIFRAKTKHHRTFELLYIFVDEFKFYRIQIQSIQILATCQYLQYLFIFTIFYYEYLVVLNKYQQAIYNQVYKIQQLFDFILVFLFEKIYNKHRHGEL